MKKEKFNQDEVNEVMYFHGQTIDGTRFTIAGIVDVDKLRMGASVCCEHDIFRKSTGRSIATTRLLSRRNTLNYGKGWTRMDVPGDGNLFQFFTKEASYFNGVKKVRLLKTFNLYNSHELPF